MAVVFLPRQFQVTVVENVNEEHLKKALWLFPLYLFAINIFVLPITFGGVMLFADGQVDADTFVLTLPMLEKKEGLALLVFIGGMSAATGMVIVETIALSTMICNDLLMPVLLRLPFLDLHERGDVSNLLLSIRRGSIVLVLLLGYAHYRFIGEFYALVSIGLVSFVAVAQFGPPILGGIFWRGGTRIGALSGLIAGFLVWGYTLVLPTLVQAGLFPARFVTHGPFDWALFKPFQMFGLQGFDYITHAVFWSMLANIGAYVGGSVFSRPSAIEHTQAALFVDVFRRTQDPRKQALWRGTASVPDLKTLLIRFLGRKRTEEALSDYAQQHGINWKKAATADAGLVNYAEKLLAGVIGSASAHVMVSTIVKSEQLRIEEVMDILDETRQVIAYSRKLEKATTDLQAANERLKELDRLKDEFISTVTHELKTPLTSVRALAEILHDNPDVSHQQHEQFTAIIIKEIDRLTRLIVQVLEFQKIESGKMEWQISDVDFKEVVEDAYTATRQIIEDENIHITLNTPEVCTIIKGDRDRLVQVMVNLISNAVKFCHSEHGNIWINVWNEKTRLRVDVKDNGIGIRPEDQEIIFEEFRQVKHASKGRPAGTGLGLPITKRIITYHGGRIWVNSEVDHGATFSFFLPIQPQLSRINLCKDS
jgi:signal transduction histidine kinase